MRECAERLDAYFRARIGGEKEILVCDVCDGHSPSDFSDCPFCGESGVDFTRTKPISEVDGVQEKTVYYTDDLDRMQREIYRDKRAIGRALYRVGKILAAVRRNALWRLRRDRVTKKQDYHSFQEWVESEGYFSYASAARLIAIVARTTAEQCCEDIMTELPACVRTWDLKKRLGVLGVKFCGVDKAPKPHLQPILRYTEEDGHHIEIFEESADGKVSVELEQEDGTTEIVRIPEVLIRTPVQRRPFRPVRPENRMERVDLNIGLSRVKFWRRQGDKPARELADDPWFELPLNETLKLLVRVIKNPAGELEAICETKRTS
jgi:hypothetical protein